jgi:hypothetical protein
MRRIMVIGSLVVAINGTAAAGWAHVFTAPTALSIQQRGGPVDAGETVTITGKLAGRPPCRAGQSIDLVRLGGGLVATTTTDASGRYRFEITAVERFAVQARFGGSSAGVHPHSHLCDAATSRLLRLKITGEAGPLVLGEGSRRAGGGEVIAAAADGTPLTGGNVVPIGIAAVALLVLGVTALSIARRRTRPSA